MCLVFSHHKMLKTLLQRFKITVFQTEQEFSPLEDGHQKDQE